MPLPGAYWMSFWRPPFDMIMGSWSLENSWGYRVKIFDSHHLTADMVMALACLPQMFQAVVTDGVPYRDGGYMGKAPLSGWSDTLTISERAVRLICGLCSSAGSPQVETL